MNALHELGGWRQAFAFKVNDLPADHARRKLCGECRAGNRADAWAIADAIADALDDVEPAIDAPFVPADVIRASQAGDVVEPGSDKMVFVDLTVTIEQH